MNAPFNPLKLSNPTLQHALAYAGMGMSVLPIHGIRNGKCTCGKTCPTPGKHPRIPNGVNGAIGNALQITSWFTRWPNANIGIATGAQSKIFVVDVDPRNRGDESLALLEEDYGTLPSTLTARTGGGGTHFYFRMPAGIKLSGTLGGSKIRYPGIDIQADGKYVVAAPSTTTGAYNWLDCDEMPTASMIADAPPWLVDLASGRTVRATPRQTDPSPPLAIVTLPAYEIERVESALARCFDPADSYQRWIDVGMALHSTGAGERAFDMWCAWSEKSAAKPDRYNKEAQKRKWDSFRSRDEGITIGTIFKIAEANGWIDPYVAEIRESLLVKNLNATAAAPTEPPQAASSAQEIVVVEPLEDVKPTIADRIPGVLGQVEDYYNETSIVKQPAFAAVASIALGSVALGRRYVARASLDSYPTLYLCEVVDTGCGKEHVRTVVDKFLQAADLDALIGPAGYTSALGVFTALRERPTHVTFFDELGRHLTAIKKSGNSHQQEMITELMKLWGALGSDYRYRAHGKPGITNKEIAALISEDAVVRNPALTLIGASTPAALYGAVGEAGIVDGFLNRILFFFGDSRASGSVFSRRDEPATLPADVITWLKRVRPAPEQAATGTKLPPLPPDASWIRPTPSPLTFDAQAQRVVLDLEAQVVSIKKRASESGLREVYVRTVEKAMRLALIAAISDDRREINGSCAEWAARRALASDSALEQAAMGNIAETDHGKLRNAVWNAIRTNGAAGLASGTLATRCHPYRDSNSFARGEAIKTLLADGKLVKEVRAGANGRMYEYFVATKLADQKE